jgi:hypothetical protein
MGREWGGVEKRGGQFTSNLKPRWTGSYHSKEGFLVSKGDRKGSKGNQQGEIKEQGDCAMYIVTCICVYNNA